MKTIKGKVQWGIIGAGDVCEKKSGPAFSKVPDSELQAIMRRNTGKAEDYARRHHVPRYYSSADALLADPDINAVYIATPPVYHEPYAKAAAESGKQVYIEKPVTLDAAGCARLIEVAKQHSVRMSVAHYRRRLPLFLKVRELIENGTIGKVRLVNLRMLQSPETELVAKTEENWRVVPELSGGGLFHDLAPHQLDVLCWLFGKPIYFSGKSYNQGKYYDAPDITFLDAVFPNDIYLEGLWSFNVDPGSREDRCEIFGEKGSIRFSFFWSPLIQWTHEKGTEHFEAPSPDPIQQPLIADVVRYFRGEVNNPSSLEEALWTMELMDCTVKEGEGNNLPASRFIF